MRYEKLSNDELHNLNGGFWGYVVSGATSVATDAWHHTDQIVSGGNKESKKIAEQNKYLI